MKYIKEKHFYHHIQDLRFKIQKTLLNPGRNCFALLQLLLFQKERKESQPGKTHTNSLRASLPGIQ